MRRDHRGKNRRFEFARSLSAGHGAQYTEIMAKKSARKIHRQKPRKAQGGKASKPAPSAAKADAKAAPARRRQWTQCAKSRKRSAASRPPTPSPRRSCKYVNPFTLLVAVVLSAQATDAGVNKATPALFALADTPEKMAALGEDHVRDLIKTIGLFRTKAKNVVALSHILVDRARRPGAALARGAGGAAGRRPQDRQCRAQRRLRRADHRGRHPYFPRRQPHRAGAGQDAVRGRAELEQVVPAKYKRTPIIGLFCTGATLAWRGSRCAKNASSRICANGREKRSCKNAVGESGWKAAASAKRVDISDPKRHFRNAGLPDQGVALPG